ncbi:hypothetical protein EDD21DRAFT_56210 [Dissophora ornata]|nr:hypothetical protein EDD21DRAFT_56210 [Dissophora ornata]
MLVEQPETIDSNRIVATQEHHQHQQQHSSSDNTNLLSLSDPSHDTNKDDSCLDSASRVPDGTTRRRSQKKRNSRQQQQDRPALNKDTSVDQAQGRSSTDCQRVPSLRSGSKRAIRPRQGSQCHHTAEECQSLRVTLPRPRVTTTTVAMTTRAAAAGTASNVIGSASEQDEVEVRGLPSPGWKKRARVQNRSRNLSAGEALSATAKATKSVASGGGGGGESSDEQDNEAESDYDDASDELTDSRDDGHSEATVTRSASGAGSRRGSQTLYHYHHHHSCSAHSAAAATSNTRSNHHQPSHNRTFSSPSLLDSFTSLDPMLSPIQSYFGSDPNSPASSFSLPRHDHYPRMTIDPSSALMDGYHGFATHPWSEQSTIPSRALSHRWTRRLSQSDAYCNSSIA